MGPTPAGDLRAGVDQLAPHSTAAMAGPHEQVIHQHDLRRVRRAEGPVQGGEPDQVVAEPRSQQQTILAGGKEPTKEGPVPRVVGFGSVEALVPGDEREGHIQVPLGERTHVDSVSTGATSWHARHSTSHHAVAMNSVATPPVSAREEQLVKPAARSSSHTACGSGSWASERTRYRYSLPFLTS